jgi:osmotically-inducible protein OsmY
MNKFVGVIFLVTASACSAFVAKTNNTIEISTGTYRTTAQISLDHKIDSMIVDSIKKDKKLFLRATKLRDIGSFDINTFNNVVLLTGIVYSEQCSDFILKKIGEMPGTIDVINELIIDASSERSSTVDFFTKRAIESKIKVKIPVRTINYRISVVNGVVYIIGVAESERELDVLLKSISTVRGVKEVVSYVRIDRR